jgi:hypothetical protein
VGQTHTNTHTHTHTHTHALTRKQTHKHINAYSHGTKKRGHAYRLTQPLPRLDWFGIVEKNAASNRVNHERCGPRLEPSHACDQLGSTRPLWPMVRPQARRKALPHEQRLFRQHEQCEVPHDGSFYYWLVTKPPKQKKCLGALDPIARELPPRM